MPLSFPAPPLFLLPFSRRRHHPFPCPLSVPPLYLLPSSHTPTPAPPRLLVAPLLSHGRERAGIFLLHHVRGASPAIEPSGDGGITTEAEAGARCSAPPPLLLLHPPEALDVVLPHRSSSSSICVGRRRGGHRRASCSILPMLFEGNPT